MVINEEAYVGLGREKLSNEIWKYNHLNDSWESFQNAPSGMEAVESFNVGSIGYIIAESNEKIELWEFDPNQN